MTSSGPSQVGATLTAPSDVCRGNRPGNCCNLPQSRFRGRRRALAQSRHRLRSTRSWHGAFDHGLPSSRPSPLPSGSSPFRRRSPRRRRARPPRDPWKPRAPGTARALRARQSPPGSPGPGRVPRERSHEAAAGTRRSFDPSSPGPHHARGHAAAAGVPAPNALRARRRRSTRRRVRCHVPREWPAQARRPQTERRRRQASHRRDTRRRAPAPAKRGEHSRPRRSGSRARSRPHARPRQSLASSAASKSALVASLRASAGSAETAGLLSTRRRRGEEVADDRARHTPPQPPPKGGRKMTVSATCYILKGTTASGLPTGPGHRRRRPDRHPARHADLHPRLREGRRRRYRRRDQGQHHRPLVLDVRGVRQVGPAHRDDHDLLRSAAEYLAHSPREGGASRCRN